ncbi:SAP domain-containing protein [Hymenobacter ruber]
MAKTSTFVSIDDLRAQARKHGLDTSGRKGEIQKRLEDAGHYTAKEDPTLFPAPSLDSSNSISSGQTLFLQLPVDNIGRYFKRGVFYPLALELDEDIKRIRQPDLLTKCPGYLVLAPGSIDYLEESDVLVELFLQPIDEIKLRPFHDVFLYPEPLPISRIKKLLFHGEKARTRFLANANTFKDYFAPAQLTGVISDSVARLNQPEFETDQSPSESNTLITDSQPIPWNNVLAKYDRILGLFAYLRNSSTVLAAKNTSIQEYPNDALAALHLLNEAAPKQATERTGLFNYLLRRSTPNADNELSPSRRLFFETVAAIYDNETPTYAWAAEHIKSIGSSLPAGVDPVPLRNAFKTFEALTQSGQTTPQDAIRSFNQPNTVGDQDGGLDIPFVSLVLLGRYSNRERTNTDKQVALNFLRKARFRATELGPLLAMLGLYYGYERMPRQDENAAYEFLPDSPFHQLAQRYGRLHFSIERPLDRAIVECCFQFALTNNTGNNDLAFLELTKAVSSKESVSIAGTNRNPISKVFGVPVFRDEMVPRLETRGEPRVEPRVELIQSNPVQHSQSQSLQSSSPSTISILRAAYPNGTVPVGDSLIAALDQLRPNQVTLPVEVLAQIISSLTTEQRDVLLSLMRITRGSSQNSGTTSTQGKSSFWKK